MTITEAKEKIDANLRSIKWDFAVVDVYQPNNDTDYIISEHIVPENGRTIQVYNFILNLNDNRFLSDRKKPDYENSIKESISAVEALCAVATNARGSEATLGKMLSKLESSGVVIHPAMRSAFNCHYGYTSDAKGIRHAGNIGGPEATFEEAKYMLVSCCAFVNYITALFAD